MKLYNGISPNGSRVMIFLKEAGIEIETELVNIMQGETREEKFLAINPLGEVPVLILDDGTTLTESIAICRYLEQQFSQSKLFGNSAKESAIIEMWMRRIELRFFEVVGSIGLHEIELFKDVVEQNQSYAMSQRKVFQQRLVWLNDELADGRDFIAGNTFTMADIIGMSSLFLVGFLQIQIPEKLIHLNSWVSKVISRESFPQMSN